MDEKTLTALKASIEKWERNAVINEPHDALVFGENCPLCVIFCLENGDCSGCPVQQKTGLEQCDGSPWYGAFLARNKWGRGTGSAADFHAAAREEVAFLKSLLPASEQSS